MARRLTLIRSVVLLGSFCGFLIVLFILTVISNSEPTKYVFLISIDGMQNDFIWRRDELGLRIPTLRKMISEGVLAKSALSVFPSVTYAAHTSMITGVNPDVHGIWANKMFSPSDQTTTQNWFFFDVKAPTITQVSFSLSSSHRSHCKLRAINIRIHTSSP
jgi:predicted AlkP superfamily pyrophosphatase or phosphodiesterase